MKNGFIILLVIIPVYLFGQHPHFYHISHRSDTNTFWLNLESAGFLKNNEYFSDYTDGFTTTGAVLRPSLLARPSHKFSVSAGVQLTQVAGFDDFFRVDPIISLHYKPSKSWTLRMGELFGSTYHELAEPVYRSDRLFLDKPEYGVQLLLDHPFFQIDTWLHWETFIEKGDPFQERLYLGSTLNTPLYLGENERSFIAKIQLLIHHRGGQIDTSPDELLTTLNLSGGFEYTLPAGTKKWIFDITSFLYDGIDIPDNTMDPNFLPVDKGRGIYPKISLETGGWYFELGYWYAKDFYAPGGEHQFHSLNENADFVKSSRSLFVPKITWKQSIDEGLSISALLEGYWDLDSGTLDHAASLYLIYTGAFSISNIKQ